MSGDLSQIIFSPPLATHTYVEPRKLFAAQLFFGQSGMSTYAQVSIKVLLSEFSVIL